MSRKKRRARQKRHKGTFRRYTLYYLLALVLLCTIGTVLCMTVFFRISSINVSGCTVYSESDVAQTSGIERGDNLLRLHTHDIAEKIRAQYPYFDEVTVRRVLPDSVSITVTEAKESTALRGDEGTYDILSESGRCLRADIAVCPEGLIPTDGFSLVSDVKAKDGDTTTPLVAGAQLSDSESARYEALLSLLSAIEASGLSDKINVIDLSDTLDIRLLYDGRLAISVGGGTDLDYKLRFAALAIEKNVGDDFVGTLDVSQKPSARLRETDIYSENAWPFADDLLAEYERKIVHETPWLDAEDSDDASGEGEDTGTAYTAPAADDAATDVTLEYSDYSADTSGTDAADDE